jgi:hypothetical protein
MGDPLPKAFLEALADTFDEYGRESLRTFRADDPADYARTFAHLIPKDAASSEIYSDAQLEKIYDAVSARLAKAARNGVETIN